MTDAPAPSRRRPRPDCQDADDATNSKQIRAFKVDEDDLKCVVCMEFPDGKIFQCPNGHLLCEECHERVIDAYQCVCPTCRAKLSRDRPSRNRFAESVLATVVVPCPNAGCGERLPFGKVRAHAADACSFRIATCKFAPLGCDWNDINSKLKAHERDCALRQKSAKSILKRILERSAQQKADEHRTKAQVQAQLKIAELLSSRCRDIVIREVVVERDTICDVVASKPFKAFGAVLCLELESAPGETTPPGDAAAPVADVPETNVGLVLTQRSRRAKRLRLTAFLLKGPDSEIADFAPVVVPVQFSRSKRSSDPFPLPLTQTQAKDMFEMGSLTVRIGLVDRRRGLSRSFSNDAAARAGGGGGDDESSSYSSSSEDQDGFASDDPDLHYYSTSSDDDDCIHTYMDDDEHGDDIALY